MLEFHKNHDLRLPDWGPYSKRYAGISHIPDVRRGLRFDLGIVPGQYRRQMLIPNEKWASGCHAWEAAPDLSYYAYRYELEWKDRVYCDVSFTALSEHERLIRCAFVNTTDLPQNLMLHLLGHMNFPPVKTYSNEAIRPVKVILPEDGVWVDALDYDDLQFATPRPTDNLVEDGFMRAEVRDHGFTGGHGIGTDFGAEFGDQVTFQFSIAQELKDAVLVLRYRLKGKQPVSVQASGVGEGVITFTAHETDAFGFSLAKLTVENLDSGKHTLHLTSMGGGAFDLDGFAVLPQAQANNLRFEEHIWSPIPRIMQGGQPLNQSLDPNAPEAPPTIYSGVEIQPTNITLHYPDVPDVVYGVAWDHPDFWIRQILHDELDSFLRVIVPDNYTDVHHGSGEGHFTDVFIRPIFIEAHAEVVVYSLVCSGTSEEVQDAIERFNAQSHNEHEMIYTAARAKAITMSGLPSAENYRFSQERMAATELINVVYPVYTQRQFIRHYTPGKWWDCLYTWDSGFIGLALLELDIERAVDNLNAYLTEAGNDHAAFIHHGSPVPVQIYLFHEIWNRTQNPHLLERFYPSLRQYYLFLAGHSGSSTTRNLKSNLLRTWEYFFWDSGGWDDYPAQVYTQNSGIAEQITCVAITAHVIRSAQILSECAAALGLNDDRDFYIRDVALLTDALQRFAWDADSGYFSYVVHDEDGEASAPLMHPSGVNYNRGLDGIMPLIAGVCTPEQEALFFERLQDPQQFWTRIGLSTVDQSAPYYRKDGYWNGSVWMPQQWFIWKAALDLGRGDFAYQIAQTALDLWKAEVEASYYCFEHFIIGTGRGAGWHQFGGLSSPVLAWFSAYHRIGRLTTGFNVRVESQHFNAACTSMTARLRHYGKPRTSTVIITLNPAHAYHVEWNHTVLVYKELHAGCLQIDLPFAEPTGELTIYVTEGG